MDILTTKKLYNVVSDTLLVLTHEYTRPLSGTRKQSLTIAQLRWACFSSNGARGPHSIEVEQHGRLPSTVQQVRRPKSQSLLFFLHPEASFSSVCLLLVQLYRGVSRGTETARVVERPRGGVGPSRRRPGVYGGTFRGVLPSR